MTKNIEEVTPGYGPPAQGSTYCCRCGMHVRSDTVESQSADLDGDGGDRQFVSTQCRRCSLCMVDDTPWNQATLIASKLEIIEIKFSCAKLFKAVAIERDQSREISRGQLERLLTSPLFVGERVGYTAENRRVPDSPSPIRYCKANVPIIRLDRPCTGSRVCWRGRRSVSRLAQIIRRKTGRGGVLQTIDVDAKPLEVSGEEPDPGKVSWGLGSLGSTEGSFATFHSRTVLGVAPSHWAPVHSAVL